MSNGKRMDYTITERQRRYRERMYKAGLKEMRIWVKRKEPKNERMSFFSFLQRLKRLTTGWDSDRISMLLNLFIKIAIGKKEEEKQKERAQQKGGDNLWEGITRRKPMEKKTESLNVVQLSLIFEISETTVRKLAKEGELPCNYLKKRLSFNIDELIKHFELLEGGLK